MVKITIYTQFSTKIVALKTLTCTQVFIAKDKYYFITHVSKMINIIGDCTSE